MSAIMKWETSFTACFDDGCIDHSGYVASGDTMITLVIAAAELCAVR